MKKSKVVEQGLAVYDDSRVLGDGWVVRIEVSSGKVIARRRDA